MALRVALIVVTRKDLLSAIELVASLQEQGHRRLTHLIREVKWRTVRVAIA